MLDEADRLLNMDFEQEIDQILKIVPKERRTQLFSATMTSKVAKLQRACLTDPVKVEVDSKYQTVDTLRQQYLFIPAKYKVELVAGYNNINRPRRYPPHFIPTCILLTLWLALSSPPSRKARALPLHEDELLQPHALLAGPSILLIS